MKVFTPKEVAATASDKYLGVLVSAKYTRELNSLPRETLPLGEEKKLTTRSLEALTSGQIEFRLVKTTDTGGGVRECGDFKIDALILDGAPRAQINAAQGTVDAVNANARAIA